MVIDMDMNMFFNWVKNIRETGEGKDNYQRNQNMTGEMSQNGWRPEPKTLEDTIKNLIDKD